MADQLRDALNDATQRDDDDMWLTYDSTGLFSVHVGPEPEFSQDEGLIQINASKMPLEIVAQITEQFWAYYQHAVDGQMHVGRRGISAK